MVKGHISGYGACMKCKCQSKLGPHGSMCFVHAAVVRANLPAAEAIQINKHMERIYGIDNRSPA